MLRPNPSQSTLPRQRGTRRRAAASAWFLTTVAGLVSACGTVDARRLTSSNQAADESGGTRSASGTGGKSSGAGGASHGGSGGTAPGGSDGFDTGGAGDVAGNPATCGNGVVEGDEECDDGNLQPGDQCDAQCRKETCGNGRVDAGEQCDPPKALSCTDNCNDVIPTCGDGSVQGSEECDDGNDKAGDGCFECRKECGDGTIDASIGEDCEPEYSPAHCSLDCHWLPTCGDGVVQPDLGEQCDAVSATCVACRSVKAPECDGEAGCGGNADQCTPDGGTVQNGAFDTTSDGWIASSPGITLSVVSDGSPDPKSLEVSYANSPVRAEAGAYECLPIGGALKYTFEGRCRVPSDAPDGIGAAVTALLYSGTQCSGTFLKAFNGPLGTARDAWTPYSFELDMSQVSASPPLRLMLRVDVVRPGNVNGSSVRWDSIALTAPGPRCGDCSVDTGEQCDDGALNGTAGDHCSTDCHLQRCGDGVLDSTSGEKCDDGNTTFSGADMCTPGCRKPDGCDTCSAGACKSQLDACFGLTGTATGGPRVGTARSTLCDELLSCVRTTSCDLATRPNVDGKPNDAGAYLENCYCGTTGAACFDDDRPANGSCRAQVEAALESAEPGTLIGRFDGKQPAYPIFQTVRELIACQQTSCDTGTACQRTPSCGDGLREDRNLTDAIMTVAGKAAACNDALTTSGHGCSFEECDDGNTTAGDGCDSNCLLEACGNYVTQGNEDCDDGDANGTPGDGCSAKCTALYHCHTDNGVVEHPYEECDRGPLGDPANAGAACTQAQAASNPDSCACDDKCKLVVCGNGVVQPGEQCEPPNTTTCDGSCHSVGGTPCESCITDSVDGAALSAYCSGDQACLDVLRCVVGAACFNPLPAFCYCGTTDVDLCQTDAFVPTGACHSEYRAGEPTAADNFAAIQQQFDFTTSTGKAMSILSDVNASIPECAACCTPQPGEPASDCTYN